MEIDIVGEMRTLSSDLGSLTEAFRENVEDRAEVLRMSAAKAEHVAQVFRMLAEAVESGAEWVKTVL